MDPIQSWVDPDEVRRLAEGLISPPPRRTPPRDDAGYGAEWVGFAEDAGANRPPGPSAPSETAAPAPGGLEAESPGQAHARQALAAARRIAEESGLLSSMAPVAPSASAAGSAPPETSVPQEAPRRAPAPAPNPAPQESSPPVRPAAPEPARPPAAANLPTSPFVERLQRFGAWLRENFGARAYFVTNRDGDILIDEVRSAQLLQVARTLAHASRTANRQAGGVAVGSLHIKLGSDGVLEVIPLNCRYGPLVLGVIVPEVLSPQHVEAAASGLQQVVDGSAGNP